MSGDCVAEFHLSKIRSVKSGDDDAGVGGSKKYTNHRVLVPPRYDMLVVASTYVDGWGGPTTLRERW